ncbi:hypothetical protein BGZ91_007849 [Linnemannia elongata]|nr:hypothetical protein BGZ91_007849 [Linnemannia elongata]
MTDYEPLDWPAFFQSKRQYAIPPQKDPTNIVYNLYESNAGRKHLPVIVLVHGAGHCARSFALVAQALHASPNLSLHARILCLSWYFTFSRRRDNVRRSDEPRR